MSRKLLIVPVGHDVGLTSVSLGLIRALDRQGIHAAYAKPIAQPREGVRGRIPDRAVELVANATHLEVPEPIDTEEAERYLAGEGADRLMEEVIARIGPAILAGGVTLIEGLVPTDDQVYSVSVNQAMASALDAEVVLVGAPNGREPEDVVEDFGLAARAFAEVGARIAACILNKLEDGFEPAGGITLVPEAHAAPVDEALLRPYREGLAALPQKLSLTGAVPRRAAAGCPRVSDVAHALRARVIRAGNMEHRRVASVVVGAMGAERFLERLRPGALVITPGDRHSVFMAASLANKAGTPLAGMVFTGGVEPSENLQKLCARALDGGLPLLGVPDDTYETTSMFTHRRWHLPPDDVERAELVMSLVADHVDPKWVASLSEKGREPRLSPAAFRYSVIQRARAKRRRIVLPEGDEPRTVAAATVCQDRGIADCVLLANPESVMRVAEEIGVRLPAGLEIIDPSTVLEDYIARLVELRGHRGIDASHARGLLQDNVMLGTMMLERDHVHGLVSGAVHTTANTIRPALQLIKTAPGHKIVSSVFFMCLPDQVLVYGDCAVNPDPNAEQLAQIALQSAHSAEQFGVPVRVAMISYSTGSSGSGADVEKVQEATRIAKERRPDLAIDGPLQYDAAITEDVARKKAPNSPVAGRATVFVFPDLNTGNTTYKAVQRSARVVSIGPMLQGLNKPVNDLSRGALVDDIVYTIALTAIQAET